MKKSDFTGWREVFRFAFEQGTKQKAYKGFIIFMCIITLASMPVISLIQSLSKDEGPQKSGVSTVTVYDESGLNIDYAQALADERYQDVKIVSGEAGKFDEHTKKLEESEDSTEIAVHVTYEETGYFSITYVKSADADIKNDDYNLLTDDFTGFFTEAKLRAVDVTEEQLAFINQEVTTKVKGTTETGEIAPEQVKEEGISMTEYFVLLGGLMIVMLIVNFSSGSIANSIVTEKSTRVVEYLMINVRPLALIIGKILASLLMVVIQFGAIIISYVVSCIVNGLIFGFDSLSQTMDQAGEVAGLLSQVNPLTILIAIVFILTGVLFFSILAGVAGASVSKIEEMAEGLKTLNMMMVVGSYMGIFLCIMQLNGSRSELLTTIFCIFPLSAPFITPANLLLGNIGIGYTLIGLVILWVLVVALFFFASRVYESLIFHNGKVLKTKDIIMLAKTKKKTAVKEEKQA